MHMDLLIEQDGWITSISETSHSTEECILYSPGGGSLCLKFECCLGIKMVPCLSTSLSLGG